MEPINYGTFYGVGVGPGDPELLTLKAVRVLEQCPVLAIPRTPGGDTVAYSIASQAADLEGKTILSLDFAMSRDAGVLAAAREKAAESIRAHLLAGRDVAMPVLGDVALFSTYTPLMEMLKGEGIPCVMIPGVPSFCAAAARVCRSLTEPEKPLHIIPAVDQSALSALDLPGTKVLMKSGRSLVKILDELDDRGLLERSVLVENCGMPNEHVMENIKGKGFTTSYFTTLLVPDKNP